MKRVLQAVLATVALSLISAVPAKNPKEAPPDDPADVKALQTALGNHVKLDARGNIAQIGLGGKDLDPTLVPVLRRLRHVSALATTDETDRVLDVVRNWSSVETASLAHDVTATGLASLEGMQNLHYLRADSGNVTNLGIKSVAKLKQLETLYLNGTSITDTALKDIATLADLKKLELGHCAITDAGLQHLHGMKLEELSLRSTRITNHGIDYLKDMTTLKLLEVDDTKVSEAVRKTDTHSRLEVLGGAPKKDVQVTPDDPSDAAAIMAALPLLARKDNVTDTIRDIEALHDDQNPEVWMKHLKGLHNLKVLWLPIRRTSDHDLSFLASCTSILNLDASGNPISDAGLKYIGTLSGLHELTLRNCKNISNAGLQHLSNLVNLESLDLSYTAITDDGLQYLANLRNLRGLQLDQTQTTDAGLVHLRKLTKLSVLVGGGLTRDGLKELKKYAPALIVPKD